ncbi:MAG TPA: DUF6125 family protein [Candidatus Competibacteraceae bacterium]|nr:DUF6125 family protein [Candidatus Competibacteraceae bacterium]
MAEEKGLVTAVGPVTWAGLKQELMALPKETLAELVNVWLTTYWTLQNYWMVYTEQCFGFESAAQLDERVWSKLIPAQAHRVIQVLNLGHDLPSLAALLKFTAPQWAGAGFAWEFTEVSDRRLVMAVHQCPMGTYRKAQNLELLPCKQLAPPLYLNLAKLINPKIEVTCLHAHPDPAREYVMCEWEFVLND